MTDRIYSSSPYDFLRIGPGSNCIRLLNIHPSTTEDGKDRIQCDIVVADLASHPSFTALSYVWGAFAPDPHKILCGNAEIPISANGYSALLHLRKRLGSFTIWVDAICIDQNDEHDKEKQIPLMGDIYSGASKVYIWLGVGDPATDHAMGYLSSTGFLEYFFEDGVVGGKELKRPRPWAATWSYARTRWSFKQSHMPRQNKSKMRLRGHSDDNTNASYGRSKLVLDDPILPTSPL